MAQLDNILAYTDMDFDVDGTKIHMLMHVVDGFADEIEYYKIDLSAIIERPNIAALEIHYTQ